MVVFMKNTKKYGESSILHCCQCAMVGWQFFCNKLANGKRTPAPDYSAHRCSLMNSDKGKDTYLIPVTTKK